MFTLNIQHIKAIEITDMLNLMYQKQRQKYLEPCQTHGLTTLLKKRLWHKCFPGSFAKFLRTLTGGSRAAATSKMKRFVIIVTGFQPLNVITKRSIFDVAAALDPPLTPSFTDRLGWLLLKLQHNYLTES